MTVKSSVQRLVRRLGWEVRPITTANIEQQVVKDVLKFTGVEIVLDVGANSGQWAELVFETGFSGKLISFEPIPNVHATLVARARRRGASWEVAPCAALGSERGHVEFNISANAQSSSVLPMRREHVEAAPQSAYVGKQTVAVERLDDLASGFLPPKGDLMIKIDTQGYEMHVLKGATGLLHRVVAMQLELSLVALYEGAPTFSEMLSYMQSIGFEVFNIVPVFRDKRTGRVLQVDGYFVRADRIPGRLSSGG
jgi:FkbM family methyltransferase